jgi:hypothetical protein
MKSLPPCKREPSRRVFFRNSVLQKGNSDDQN